MPIRSITWIKVLNIIYKWDTSQLLDVHKQSLLYLLRVYDK